MISISCVRVLESSFSEIDRENLGSSTNDNRKEAEEDEEQEQEEMYTTKGDETERKKEH